MPANLNETELLIQCLKIEDSAERLQYLERECQGDQVKLAAILRTLALERLLMSDQTLSGVAWNAGSTVKESAANAADTVRIGGDNARTIGPYELVEEIGTGGMGTVWRAEQFAPIRRVVAIKVIKVGMDTKEVVQRFENERQALALVNHPNIAKILDAGVTNSGTPYFVMELVEGVSVIDYCDGVKLTVQKRLQLFIAICHAIQHAHQKGVIHRDLKPSNVLVEPSEGLPIPKVIDFGLARIFGQQELDAQHFTAVGQVIGTPSYMSPEQARGDGQLDTRTDVYSLGVLLYELLSGVTPFDFRGFTLQKYSEILRTIQQDPPPRMTDRLASLGDLVEKHAASRQTTRAGLHAELRGDLEIIVEKCLSKSPDLRYSSPLDLTRDLERYMQGDAIEARPPSRIYKLRKTLQRHKAFVATVGLVMAILLLATIVSWRQTLIARDAERTSAQRLRQTRAALDSMTSVVVEDILWRQSEVTPAMRQMLTESLEMYQQFALDNRQDRESRAAIAEAHERVARIQSELGMTDDSLKQAGLATDLYKNLVEDFPDHEEYLKQYIDNVVFYGSSLCRAGRLDEAEVALEQGFKANQRFANDPSQEVRYIDNVAFLRYNQCDVAIKQDRLEIALQLGVESLQAQERVLQLRQTSSGPSTKDQAFTASILQQNGLINRRLNRFAETKSLYERAIQILEALDAEAPLSRKMQKRLGVLINDLGVVYFRENDYDRARQYYQRGLELRQRTLAVHPNMTDLMANVGGSYLNMGNVTRFQGELSESLVHYNAGAKILERVRDREPEFWWARGLLEATYRCRAETQIAAELYDDAIASLLRFDEIIQQPNKPVQVDARSQLRRAYVLVLQNRRDEAWDVVRNFDEAVARGAKVDLAVAAYHRAVFYAALSQAQPEFRNEALQHLTEALQRDFDYCDVKRLPFTADPDFEPLHDEPAYIALVANRPTNLNN